MVVHRIEGTEEKVGRIRKKLYIRNMENTKTKAKNVLRTLKALKYNTIKMKEAELINRDEAKIIIEITEKAIIKYGKEV